MKKNLLPVFLVTLISALTFTKAYSQFQFISPVPSSIFNKPETNIILGSALEFDESTIHSKKIFSVVGSLSGKHEVEIVRCEKGKTLLLNPIKPFSYGETVSVAVGEGIRSTSGKKLSATNFTFQIQPDYSAEQKLQMAEQMKTVYDAGSSLNGKEKNLGGGTSGFPDFSIDVNTNPASGSVFFSHFNIFNPLIDRHYCIIKSNGDSVYGKKDHDLYNNFDLNSNGYLTLYDEIDSQFMMLDSNYYVIDSFQMGNGYKSDVHEFRILPDGSHWMICYDVQIIDLSVYDPSYKKNSTVVGCVIQKLDVNDNVVFQWRSWDHFSIFDGEHTSYSIGFVDAVHANAIEIESDGNILLSSRHMCEVTKINSTTGDIIWRLGGKNNQFTFINDSEAPQFHYQHDVRRIPNGHITMFDNGNFHSPSVSYAKEYALDEVNKTATLIWNYKRTIASGDIYSIAMGSVQRLPNGNTLIDWGLNLAQSDNPSITEIDINKNVVWEMTVANQDAVYRASRYEWNPCARPTLSLINVKNITTTSAKVDWEAATNAVSYDVQYRKASKTTWKIKNTTNTSKKLKNLAPNTEYVFQVRSICADDVTSGWSPIDTFSTLPLKEILDAKEKLVSIVVHPNPVADVLGIEFSLESESNVEINIYDITGRLTLTKSLMLPEGSQSVNLDISSFTSGVYIVKLSSSTFEVLKKVIKE